MDRKRNFCSSGTLPNSSSGLDQLCGGKTIWTKDVIVKCGKDETLDYESLAKEILADFDPVEAEEVECYVLWDGPVCTNQLNRSNERYIDSPGRPTDPIFARSVCTSVPTFQNLAKENNFQVRIVIATGGTVGLAEWIIDGTQCLVVCIFDRTRFTSFAKRKKLMLFYESGEG